MQKTQFDLIVFGATSFVGKITCRYLAEEFGTDGQRLRWAVAGRSAARLEDLRRQLGADQLPLITADAGDGAALRDLCARTRAVATTVGPYALYGEALVRACAESGTAYCDLTGEPQWIHQMIQRYEATAQRTGSRLVNCCGFDSIPSDLGVAFLQREALQRFGQPCSHVKMRVADMRGGLSGGTAASLLNAMREGSSDRAVRRALADPYLLCPADHALSTRQDAMSTPRFEREFDSWCAPFVMAAINTRVVHRSNALSGYAYGTDFRYDEAILTGPGWRGRSAAAGVVAGLAAFMLAGATPPSRWLLQRLLPAPGEGPSEQQQRQGYFDLSFVGSTADGRVLRAAVSADRDPGYGATARMFGQAAACLATGVTRAGLGGGCWTPATAFDERFTQRLRDRAGMGFTIVD